MNKRWQHPATHKDKVFENLQKKCRGISILSLRALLYCLPASADAKQQKIAPAPMQEAQPEQSCIDDHYEDAEYLTDQNTDQIL